jgi:hypothetical protein
MIQITPKTFVVAMSASRVTATLLLVFTLAQWRAREYADTLYGVVVLAERFYRRRMRLELGQSTAKRARLSRA